MKTEELKILQWNAGGLSTSKMVELKKVMEEERVDILIVNEANVTEENIKRYQMKGYNVQALYKNRQVASGIYCAVRNQLLTEFEVIQEMNPTDYSEIVNSRSG